MRKLKLNLAISGILLAVLTMLFVATTVAYFSDSKHVTNTITVGNVQILLSEASVKRDDVGHLIQDTTVSRIYGGNSDETQNYGYIYPSQSIYKDPTIENVGSEEAWVAFKVTVKDGIGDLRKLMGYPNSDHIDLRVLFSGALFSEGFERSEWNGFEKVFHNENYAMLQVGKPHEDKYEFYIFILKPLESGKKVVLFDNMTIPEEWGNLEMQELKNLVIDVEAFGVQTFNLENCYEAMTKALPKYFTFN